MCKLTIREKTLKVHFFSKVELPLVLDNSVGITPNGIMYSRQQTTEPSLEINVYIICLYRGSRTIFDFKKTTLILNYENQFLHVLVEIEVSTIHNLVKTRHNCIDFLPSGEV